MRQGPALVPRPGACVALYRVRGEVRMIYEGKLPDCYGNYYTCDHPPECPCMMDCCHDSREEEWEWTDDGLEGVDD
jgi:hypothetical protein